jgi:hypothetical protein
MGVKIRLSYGIYCCDYYVVEIEILGITCWRSNGNDILWTNVRFSLCFVRDLGFKILKG